MVGRVYPAQVGEESKPAANRKGAGKLLPVKQSEKEMERPCKGGGRAIVQILCLCKSDRQRSNSGTNDQWGY